MNITSNSARFSRPVLAFAAYAALGGAGSAAGQDAVSAGDIVETNMNGQTVIGEVIRTRGSMADLNLGQNQVVPFLDVQYMRVLQHAGTGGTSAFSIGDPVRLQYGSGTVFSGRLLNTNGAYCEIDSSQSGFTGWSKCSELSAASSATGKRSSSPVPAQGAAGVSVTTAKPPKPGFTNCAGKIEGRYASSGGFGNFTIVFRSGKATVKASYSPDEEVECWISGKQIILHNPRDTNDLPIDINDDGTLDTPFGEIKKKGG
jgi:hypothetical protein